MGLRFLFWNVRGAHDASWAKREPRLRDSLACLAASRQVDVFILAEYAFADTTLLSSLNAAGVGTFAFVPSANPRIKLLSRLTSARWTDRFHSQLNNRMTAHTLHVGASPSILVVGFHGHDRMSVSSEADRASLAQDFAADIRLIERDVGHQRTVVVGDFNMNPYEQGMTAAKGLHALISVNLTRSIHRMERRRDYSCFYNPMSSCFGDRAGRAPGTHFYANSLSATMPFWNMLDQVILRKELSDKLGTLEIVDHDGTASLLTKMGRPSKAALSDHLPLFFELNL